MNFNGVAITGHSKGIGKGLFDYYKNTNQEVKGFSRSNNYHIGSDDTLDKIINESDNCDLFFNNAYWGDAQIKLLQRWYAKNKDKNKLIVNISSIAVEVDKYAPEFNPTDEYKNYSKNKESLNSLSTRISLGPQKAKSIIISPGVVDTDMAHPMLKDLYKDKGVIISVNEIVEQIVKVVDTFNVSSFISQMTLVNNYVE